MRIHALIIFSFILSAACTKIDTTTIGVGLIPEIDNINTFDTIMQVVANNYIPADSTRLRISDEHAVGALYNDERFGDTKATLFFEMKPVFPVSRVDTLVALDSVVLVLKFINNYGANDVPLKLNLYKVGGEIARDSLLQPAYTLSSNIPIDRSRLYGTKTMTAKQFADTVSIKRGDSVYRKVVNQLRIPINKSLLEPLWRDTANALKSDSLFDSFFDGFALEVEGQGKTMFYHRLTNEESGLEFYYRSKRQVTGIVDTTSEKWTVNAFCGHANRFERFRSGSEVENFLVQDPVNGHSQIYLQSAPGTAAKLTIPGLASLTNRVIHRAELRIVQLGAGSATATTFTAPTGIYLDRKELNSDTSYAGLPYDLSPLQPYFCYPFNGIDFSYFGGIAKRENIAGTEAVVYRMNIARYLQNVISRGDPIFEMRLSAPFYMVYANCQSAVLGWRSEVFPYQLGNSFINPVGVGQVSVAGGNHPNSNLRMQLRIIYSKL